MARRRGPSCCATIRATSFSPLGILINVMWHYAAHGHRLLGDHVDPETARRIGRHFFIGPAGYAVGTLVALVLPWAALPLYMLLNVFYLWPRRKARPDPA